MVRAGAYWHKMHDINACAFAVHTKYSVISFGFLFRWLLSRHCKTFNINAEKPKFNSSTKRIFYTGGPLRKPIKSKRPSSGVVIGALRIHFVPVYFDEK